MWQIEDLIRAYGCSIGRIKREYISKFSNLTDEQKEDELDWFDNLIRMMNEEGKREKGHLNVNAIIIQDLTDLHQQLLDSNRFPFYNAEYYKVLPFIVELRRKGNAEVGEIETCFNALYGKMLLQMNRRRSLPRRSMPWMRSRPSSECSPTIISKIGTKVSTLETTNNFLLL